MATVIQVRGVPEETRDALAATAKAEGLSLSGYVRRELEMLARRAEAVRDNGEIVRRTQQQVRGRVEREAVLATLREGRGA